MKVHYLDNAATTKVLDAAAEKALYVMTENFGNPSSVHKMGIKAFSELESAREEIAKALSCKKK